MNALLSMSLRPSSTLLGRIVTPPVAWETVQSKPKALLVALFNIMLSTTIIFSINIFNKSTISSSEISSQLSVIMSILDLALLKKSFPLLSFLNLMISLQLNFIEFHTSAPDSGVKWSNPFFSISSINNERGHLTAASLLNDTSPWMLWIL